MLEFLNLEQNAPIFAVVGAISFILGFILKGNAKKSNGAGVGSMFLMTIGAVALLIAISYFVTTSLTDWAEYSERMR